MSTSCPNQIRLGWVSTKPGQVQAYGSDLAAFSASNGFDTVPATLDAFFALDAGSAHAAALTWRDASRAAPLAVATVNRRLAALRSVVHLARQVGRVTWVLDVPDLAAVKYCDTRGPGTSGYVALVAAAAGRVDARDTRDRAVLRLLFDCALRRAEVVSLDVQHYDRDAGALWVLGKKRHERERMTLPASTSAALDAWLLHRTTTDADAPLFCRIGPSNVWCSPDRPECGARGRWNRHRSGAGHGAPAQSPARGNHARS